MASNFCALRRFFLAFDQKCKKNRRELSQAMKTDPSSNVDEWSGPEENENRFKHSKHLFGAILKVSVKSMIDPLQELDRDIDVV